MTEKQLHKTLQDHKAYVQNQTQGKRASLVAADLRNMDLSGADLRYADLRAADLRGTTLTDADLRHADLRGANLNGANCRRASLVNANLTGATMTGIDLQGADLQYAKGVGVSLQRSGGQQKNDLADVFPPQKPEKHVRAEKSQEPSPEHTKSRER